MIIEKGNMQLSEPCFGIVNFLLQENELRILINEQVKNAVKTVFFLIEQEIECPCRIYSTPE